jgi:TatD DNase family protein
MLVDSHCHAYSFGIDELESFKDILIVGVAEDYESSIRNLEISRAFPNIYPFVGAHPWNLQDIREEEVEKILEIARKSSGIGEVGLDRRYSKKTIEEQIKVFKLFCELASEENLPMNIHALDTWRECFNIVTSYDVKSVLFHWYTGPIDLLEEIASQGYYISINPAVTIQPKHRSILEKAEVDILITESDGPYLYHGMSLNPLKIRELMETIAKVKDLPLEYLERIIEGNFKKFIG